MRRFSSFLGPESVWACVLAGLIAGLYRPAPVIELVLVFAALLAIALLAAKDVRMRAVDWSAFLIGAYEIPSLFLSQYRANSIRASWVLVISVLVYFTIRLTIRTSLQIASLSGLVGLGGAWLALSGLLQFHSMVGQLRDVGFTDLVAYDVGTYFSQQDAAHDQHFNGLDRIMVNGQWTYVSRNVPESLPMYLIPEGVAHQKPPYRPFRPQ